MMETGDLNEEPENIEKEVITEEVVVKKEVKPIVVLEDPVITGVKNIDITVGDDIALLKNVSATDQYGEKTNIIYYSTPNFDSEVAGEYIVSYKTTDANGLITIEKAKVTVKPDLSEFNLIGGNQSVEINSDFKELGYIAKNKSGNDLTPIVETDFDIKKLGTYEKTYTLNDVVLLRTIKVIDTLPPVIVGAIDLTITNEDSFSNVDGVTVSDNSNEDIELIIKGVITFNDEDKKLIITYKASDSSGNVSETLRTITIKDN
jgi:hypothetical protein